MKYTHKPESKHSSSWHTQSVAGRVRVSLCGLSIPQTSIGEFLAVLPRLPVTDVDGLGIPLDRGLSLRSLDSTVKIWQLKLLFRRTKV